MASIQLLLRRSSFLGISGTGGGIANGGIKGKGNAYIRGIEGLWKGGYLDNTIGASEKAKNAKTGDAWPACLLRMKSFEDLHKLWYVCLKEKNLLMGEQWAAWQMGVKMREHGRLKKVKLSMKRILTVLTRRQIHQQCIKAKQMLKKQEEREQLEIRRFQLEEQILQMQHRIERMGNVESLTKSSWKAMLNQYISDHEMLLLQLKPLRKETMQLLTPDWRYTRKYSDLPGQISWKKQIVPALEKRFRKPIKFY